MTNLKDLFLLDPAVTYLNHGSFGACPRPVFAAYQAWQEALERQPVEFLGRKSNGLLAEARSRLASFLNVQPDEVVFFTNPTTAINMVARSLPLKPGDEILASEHEYGAIDRTWHFICKQTGAIYRRLPIPMPFRSREELVEQFWEGVNTRTRIIFLSHITSSTALILPVREICSRARQAGLLSIVDGAHAPGQISLDLASLGSDIYAGACHKWLCAPKGSAFLFARREVQPLLEPLVVSWGYEPEKPAPSRFIDYHEWQGTRDLAAFLSVPTAIQFQEEHNWHTVRQECHQLACTTQKLIEQLTGLPSLSLPDSRGNQPWYAQMFSARVPQQIDLEWLKIRLYDDYRIEVPLVLWQSQKLIRVSFQGYNDQQDADHLLHALSRLLPLPA